MSMERENQSNIIKKPNYLENHLKYKLSLRKTKLQSHIMEFRKQSSKLNSVSIYLNENIDLQWNINDILITPRANHMKFENIENIAENTFILLTSNNLEEIKYAILMIRKFSLIKKHFVFSVIIKYDFLQLIVSVIVDNWHEQKWLYEGIWIFVNLTLEDSFHEGIASFWLSKESLKVYNYIISSFNKKMISCWYVLLTNVMWCAKRMWTELSWLFDRIILEFNNEYSCKLSDKDNYNGSNWGNTYGKKSHISKQLINWLITILDYYPNKMLQILKIFISIYNNSTSQRKYRMKSIININNIIIDYQRFSINIRDIYSLLFKENFIDIIISQTSPTNTCNHSEEEWIFISNIIEFSCLNTDITQSNYFSFNITKAFYFIFSYITWKESLETKDWINMALITLNLLQEITKNTTYIDLCLSKIDFWFEIITKSNYVIIVKTVLNLMKSIITIIIKYNYRREFLNNNDDLVNCLCMMLKRYYWEASYDIIYWWVEIICWIAESDNRKFWDNIEIKGGKDIIDNIWNNNLNEKKKYNKFYAWLNEYKSWYDQLK